jgi:hypothetical protein
MRPFWENWLQLEDEFSCATTLVAERRTLLPESQPVPPDPEREVVLLVRPPRERWPRSPKK